MGFQKEHQLTLKHGHRKNHKTTKTYGAWINMKSRCNNLNSEGYKNYGGRGIIVCNRWKESFENFLADMGESLIGFMLDRIDNNGNYEPSNCRWIDMKTSLRNRRAPKLSIEKAEKIRELHSEGNKQREIAELFNINKSMVSFIVNRKVWN